MNYAGEGTYPIVRSLDHYGPELRDNPQDQHDEKDQKQDSAGDDASHEEPGLLRFSMWLSRSPP